MLRKSDHLLQTAERRSEAPLAHAPRHTRYELQSFNLISQMSASVVRSEK